jgi:hypothetical protein
MGQHTSIHPCIDQCDTEAAHRSIGRRVRVDCVSGVWAATDCETMGIACAHDTKYTEVKVHALRDSAESKMPVAARDMRTRGDTHVAFTTHSAP